jgi:hypothetical protein
MVQSRVHLLSAFRWKLGLAVALVALGDVLFYQRGLYGGTFGIYGFALIAGLIAGQGSVRGDRRAWVAMSFAGLFAGAMIYDVGVLSWSLFWIAIGMAALLPATAAFDDGWRWLQRLTAHAMRQLAAPFLDLLLWRRARKRTARRAAGLRLNLSVFMLPLAGSMIIIALFAIANPLIENLLASISFPDPSSVNLLRIALWVALFTAIWGLLRPRVARFLLPTFDGRGDLAIPGVSIASVRLSLIAFNLLFAAQNMLDIVYLWGVVPLPDGMTLAAYAHRGAYPLIATAVLAGLFVLITLRPGSRTAAAPMIRPLVIAWTLQNIFLVASSILRTVDYVEAYSLTELRVAALAWMGLVAVGLLLICWRMLRGRSASWLINANVAAAGALLSTACFVDTAAISADWNVDHAREVDGTGAGLDLCYLNALGGPALLPLIRLEQRRDITPYLRERAQSVRTDIQRQMIHDMAHGGWTGRGAARLDAATKALATVKTIHLTPGPRDCGGALIGPPTNPPVSGSRSPALTEDQQQ